MSTAAYRAALIRKVEKEMDRVDVEMMRPFSFHDKLGGMQEAYSHVLRLIKDTENL